MTITQLSEREDSMAEVHLAPLLNAKRVAGLVGEGLAIFPYAHTG